MKRVIVPLASLLALSYGASSATAPGLPSEQLSYSINWPSGLSLGESHLNAAPVKSSADTPGHLHFEFNVEAAVPAFQVLDKYQANATPGYCSVDFERKTQHGKKKTDEKTTFDQQAGTASRETEGGGKSELQISSCGKDALTYLYYVRHELSQGRLPAPQTVYFGAPYQVRMEFAGTQTIRLGEKNVEADRLSASAKGPNSDISFDVFFLKDSARTLALVRVPLSLGIFSMELVK
jgi:uncharacterized protein DUF3108